MTTYFEIFVFGLFLGLIVGSVFGYLFKRDEMLDRPRLQRLDWISTKDWLPECEPGAEVGNITFRLKSGTIYTGCFGRGGLQRDKYFRNWTDSGEGWDAQYVTHWVRLPDPEEVREKFADGT